MAEAIGALILEGLAAIGSEAAAAEVAAIAAGTGTTIISGLTVAGAIGTAAILGASIAISLATQPKVPSAGEGALPLRQAIAPRPFGYGRTRLAGAYMLYEVDGSRDSWDVYALHQGEISRFIHYMLNDDIVTLSSTGFVNGILNADPGTNRWSFAGANRVSIETRTGLATETAYADVIAALPTLWTSAHRGDTIASATVKTQHLASADSLLGAYPNGLPKASAVMDLSPIWDPRDSSQSRDDSTTWRTSSNPVLQLIDYLTDTDRGPALDYDTLIAPNIDDWMVEADACDELVAKVDGSTEARYASNGWAFLSTDPAEVISAILATCDGWLAEAGDGTLSLRVGKYSAPDITLKDDHIFGFTIDKGTADEEIVNEVQFTYTAVQANWRDVAGIAFRDEASIADLGIVRSRRLELAWVQSHSQGRRLAKRLLARQQATARGQLVTGLYGLKVLGQRWVSVQSRLIADLSDAVIEVSRIGIDLASGRVTIEWSLVNPNEIDAWDETTEEGTPPTYFPVPANVTLSDSGAGNQIRVDFDELSPAQPWLYYLVDYRTGSSGAWTRQIFHASENLASLGGGRVRLTTAAVSAGTYSVRVASTGAQMLGRTTAPVKTGASAVDAATTGPITLSGDQIIDGVDTTGTPTRVLVKDQTSSAQNGIWVSNAGAWTRAADMNSWDEVDGVYQVLGGTTNLGTRWLSISDSSGTIDVTPILFERFGTDLNDPDPVWAPSVNGSTVIIA